MKNLLKYIPVIFLACYISTQAFAQINEGYILSDAEISQVTENINVQNISKKALIILPENENQLYVRMSISNDSSEANYLGVNGNLHPELLLKLAVIIDRLQIQEALTSAKKFYTIGHLIINNTTKEVKVEYMPLPSGTEEDGDFNISIIIQFDPCDFNICETGITKQFIIKIENAVVNRV